jgi:hypothetical protein
VNQWLCNKDFENQERLYGKSFEIKLIQNLFDIPCLVCGKHADCLVSGIPELLGKPLIYEKGE